MSLTPILLFALAVLLLAFFVVILSVLVRFRGAGKKEDLKVENFDHPRWVELKFYRIVAFFVALCAAGGLLLPWVFDLEKTFGEIASILKFLFFISVILISYVFMMLSKGLDWKD